ncbi:MAG: sigma-54 factor interaction domain-containing protein [Phycisphaeraceae bacterium]
MPLFTTAQRRLVDAVAELMYCNPFLPERIACERRALGTAFDNRGSDWNLNPDTKDHANVALLLQRAQQTLDAGYRRASEGGKPTDLEAARYEELVMFVHYHRFRDGFDQLLMENTTGGRGRRTPAKSIYTQFRQEVSRYSVDGLFAIDEGELTHWFACFFQVRRAFANIFHYIIGTSEPAVRLRATVWQSIFTHDMRRYRRVLFDRMADQTTLITGASGTGKELVARAIGMSRYIPFVPQSATFAAEAESTFAPLHLAAMSPTLVESELFGHHRGAFTGAVADRVGWLENCPSVGTVFLDELGELDPLLQVKLLRVIQERTFSRLGETRQRRFEGKIIAATNRDLQDLMRRGTFRTDLYYRLCSDIVTTPTLHERLRHSSDELDTLLVTLARRVVADEAPELAAEVRRWIDAHLPADYRWPGNIRELDQCLRNVMIRCTYQPAEASAYSENTGLAHAIETTSLTAEQMLNWYCTLAYARLGSYQRAAAALQLDRRTVRARVDHDLLIGK